MCDDMDFDVSSDVSDFGFDSVDDVGSDFDDASIDYDDTASEDFSLNDIGDDSVSFDDSFEMDDVSDDIVFEVSDDIKTLDLDNEFDNSEVIETLDFDDDIETLELDNPTEEIETLEYDESLENTEALGFDDSVEDISENVDGFDLSEEIEDLDFEEDINFDLDEVADEIETLDFDDEFSQESIEEAFDETDSLDATDFVIDDLDPEVEFENDAIDTKDIDPEYYEATPISEFPTVQEDENIDGLENIENANEGVNDIQIDSEISETMPNEYVPSETEMTEVEPYQATPISDLPIVQENDEILEEIDDTKRIPIEDEFEEFNGETFEQALRDDAVDNAPLTEAIYEDDSEYPIEDGLESEIPHMTDEELEQFVNWELQHENGNYDLINNVMNDDSLTDDQKEFITQQYLDEINEGEKEVTEFGQRVMGLTYDERDIITKPEELENTFEQTDQIDDIFNGKLTENDIDAVYEGLENYDFQGVDCLENIERLDSSLESFTSENWEKLSLDEQKEKMNDLAEYIIDVTGLENPPRIEFYNNEQEGDYGGFDRTTNTLSINEHMLYQNDEAADTVAHELWHALQYQHASNPRTKLDAMYAENFNDYISPNEDFEGYQSQILESEARAFAQQIKDRLHSY